METWTQLKSVIFATDIFAVYRSTLGRFFLFVFLKNAGYQQVIPKLTDLYSKQEVHEKSY